MTSDAELAEALEWKVRRGDWKDKRQANKMQDLALWFSTHRFFTPPQRLFVEELLKVGNSNL